MPTSKDVCPKCGTGFWGLHALGVHLKKRHDPCPFCDRAFIRLQMHVRIAHPMKYDDWARELAPSTPRDEGASAP